MHRRRFLQTTAGGALAAFASIRDASAQMPFGYGMGMGMGGRMGRFLSSASTWPTGLPLRSLDLLVNASAVAGRFDGKLVAAPYAASLIAGHTTELWGYNNAFPGPMIEVWEGDRVTIDFANRLALESTVHWHGLPVPSDQDGSPMDPVAPGAGRTYSFDVPAGSAGTYWYHPHAHRTVTVQAGHGLVAPLIVRSADDPLDAIPEETLMITSLALDANGQVATTAGAMSGMGGMMMSGGGTLLVNGQRLPMHSMLPGATERWRIINATPDRYLRLSLDGHRFTVVGTDGGLLGQPLPNQSEWLLAPAQRVEVVVTVTAQPMEQFALRDLGYGGGMGTSGNTELMTVATGRSLAQAPIPVPTTLRPVADLGPATARQQVVLSGMGMMGSFLINGRTFDMKRVDLQTVVGRVELWDIVNTTYMDHPIHIHGTQFQVVARTVRGVAAPIPYPAWLDTVNVPAGETVTIKTQQTMPGTRMFHCHILPHEDAGMMAVLDVRPA